MTSIVVTALSFATYSYKKTLKQFITYISLKRSMVMPDVLGGGGGVINKIRCKMKGSSSPSYIEFNQQLITDRRSICSLFNTYFTDVANKLNSDKYHNAPPPPEDFRVQTVPNIVL